MYKRRLGNILSHNGATQNILSSQTENLDRNQELLMCSHSWIWVDTNDLGYLRGWKSFIPFGNSMKVLPSQSCILVRNFEKLHRELGWMDWSHLWCSWVIYEGWWPYQIAAQLELGIKHFLCKILEKAETCIGSCAQFLIGGTWDKDGTSDYIAMTNSSI